MYMDIHIVTVTFCLHPRWTANHFFVISVQCYQQGAWYFKCWHQSGACRRNRDVCMLKLSHVWHHSGAHPWNKNVSTLYTRLYSTNTLVGTRLEQLCVHAQIVRCWHHGRAHSWNKSFLMLRLSSTDTIVEHILWILTPFLTGADSQNESVSRLPLSMLSLSIVDTMHSRPGVQDCSFHAQFMKHWHDSGPV